MPLTPYSFPDPSTPSPWDLWLTDIIEKSKGSAKTEAIVISHHIHERYNPPHFEDKPNGTHKPNGHNGHS